MRRYRNIWHRAVADVAPGAEGELELSSAEEREYLDWGRLEILPAEYEVIGPKRVNDCNPGETFAAAFTIGQEAHLLASGHLTRVESKPKRLPKPDSDRGN